MQSDAAIAAEQAKDLERLRQVNSQPFDPRSEISADARFLVRQLVLWFLVLPVLLGLLIWALSSLTR